MRYMMGDVERKKLVLICGALDGKYTVKYVAKALKLRVRRVKQLKAEVKRFGDEAVVHGNSCRHPSNYKPDELRERIIRLKCSEEYVHTNFTHFCELLRECEGIDISRSTVSNILKGASDSVAQAA